MNLVSEVFNFNVIDIFGQQYVVRDMLSAAFCQFHVIRDMQLMACRRLPVVSGILLATCSFVTQRKKNC